MVGCTPGGGLPLALLRDLLLKALRQLLHLGHPLLIVLLHALKVPAAGSVLPLESSSEKRVPHEPLGSSQQLLRLRHCLLPLHLHAIKTSNPAVQALKKAHTCHQKGESQVMDTPV